MVELGTARRAAPASGVDDGPRLADFLLLDSLAALAGPAAAVAAGSASSDRFNDSFVALGAAASGSSIVRPVVRSRLI
jgi:hypothetical protein